MERKSYHRRAIWKRWERTRPAPFQGRSKLAMLRFIKRLRRVSLEWGHMPTFNPRPLNFVFTCAD